MNPLTLTRRVEEALAGLVHDDANITATVEVDESYIVPVSRSRPGARGPIAGDGASSWPSPTSERRSSGSTKMDSHFELNWCPTLGRVGIPTECCQAVQARWVVQH